MEKTEPNPLISIIIAVLNRRELLVRTLASIESQRFRDFELIISDNGSDDGTAEVIENWKVRFEKKGIRTVGVTEPRRGICQARNRGLREARGKYVMFFDSDDEMLPGHLELLAGELTQHPEIDLMWFDIKEQDEDGWTSVKSVDDRNEMRGHILHSTLASARFVVSRELLVGLGGLDESIYAWEDVELGVRLLAAAKKKRKLNCEPQVVVHPHRDSITGSSFANKRESLERSLDLCEEALKRYGREDECVWVDVKRMVLAGLYAREGEKELSARLSDKVLAKTGSGRRRIALGFVRDTVAYFGRGGCAIGKALIRQDKGSK